MGASATYKEIVAEIQFPLDFSTTSLPPFAASKGAQQMKTCGQRKEYLQSTSGKRKSGEFSFLIKFNLFLVVFKFSVVIFSDAETIYPNKIIKIHEENEISADINSTKQTGLYYAN